MITVLNTGPGAEPVLLADAKTHIRETTTSNDAYITTLLTVAREQVEQELNRKLITQTWDLYLEAWPLDRVIILPFGSLQSVTSVKYTDTDAVENTFSSDDYSVDTASGLGRVVLDGDASWPSASLASNNPIVVRLVCGYGDAGANVPGPIIQAVKLAISDLYENRESAIVGVSVNILDIVSRLLAPYRLYGYHL